MALLNKKLATESRIAPIEERRAAAIAWIDDRAATIILQSIRTARFPLRAQALLGEAAGRGGLLEVNRREDLRPRNGDDRHFYSSDIDRAIHDRIDLWQRLSRRFRVVPVAAGPWPAATAAARWRRERQDASGPSASQ